MKKLILIVLAAVILLSLIIAHADELPVPEQIKVGGEVYNLNMDIVKSDGYAVYGSHEDIPNNDYREGEYRYLGFNMYGSRFYNFEFPWDSDSGRTDAERAWIEKPWTVIGNNGPLEIKKSKLNENPQAVEWLDSLNIGGGWTGEKLLDYFNIQSPVTDYTAGSIVGWHFNAGTYWYKTFYLPPLKKIDLTGELNSEESIVFTVNHYEKGTENEVYPSDVLTNPQSPAEVYAKSGIGLDGNEWICTVPSPQTVQIVDGGEYNFYYTKKPEPPAAGEGQLILVKDPLVKANCKMPGRKNIPDTRGGKYPDGLPLFRGDLFKPTGIIHNPNGRDVFVEYSMKLKDKPDKNFRQINSKFGEGITAAGGSLTDSFTKKIDNNDRYGNVYVLTVEARQRIIVPTPPPEPGPKPTKPSRPHRDDYDSYSDYRDDLEDYYDALDDYYDALEAWYERKEKWDAYVDKWGDPDAGEVFIYKTYNGRDIWFSEKYGWRSGKGEDMNYVMLKIQTDIEDMDGGLKEGVITE